jgi:acyl carrier protein
MSTDRTLESAVFAAVDVANQHLPREKWLGKTADTKLVGESSHVDSLTLISYVVALEQVLESDFGYSISLTDDSEIMTNPDGPLRNLGELVRYLETKLTT